MVNVRVGKVGTVIIGNKHAGGFSFPRKGKNGIVIAPFRIPPGGTALCDREEWEKRKRNPLVSYLLDVGILVELRKEGPVGIDSNTTVELEIPDILRDDDSEFGGKETAVTAKLMKKNVTQLTVTPEVEEIVKVKSRSRVRK